MAVDGVAAARRGMRRQDESLRVLPEDLDHVELGRPAAIDRQQPECWPQSLAFRHVCANLEVAVTLREAVAGGEQTGRVGLALHFRERSEERRVGKGGVCT